MMKDTKKKRDIGQLGGIINAPDLTLEEVKWERIMAKYFKGRLYEILDETKFTLEQARDIINEEIRRKENSEEDV